MFRSCTPKNLPETQIKNEREGEFAQKKNRQRTQWATLLLNGLSDNLMTFLINKYKKRNKYS